MSRLDEAKIYHGLGLSVIPVRKDKKPLIKWQPYQKEKAGPEKLIEWWRKWPDANIGLVTGAISDFMVVDVDSQAGHDALSEFLPDNIQTPVVKTPSGGWHYYFRYQKGLVNRARVITDCDVRTDGGYVVAPASVGANGKAYSFVQGLGIRDVSLASMPDMLFSILQGGGPHCQNASTSEQSNKVEYTYIGAVDNLPDVHTSPRMSTSVHIDFSKGGRDEALFRLANCLVKGGMSHTTIQKYLLFFGEHCSPPFPEKEIQAKIQSALKRSESREKNLAQEVREFVLSTSGHFLSTDVHKSLDVSTRRDRKNVSEILRRLLEEGIIERTGSRNGQFRLIESECDEMDFLNAETETADVWLPFNLHRLVETMPGNIILIAGEPNAGKTGLILNIIQNNQHKFETHYFNSEMGGSELRKRLSLFTDILPSQWRFKAWERADNFADVIKPGKGRLNIIDFLELHDNFYEVGGRLAEIHKKLKGAIAIIALQKNAGVDTGLGGFRGLEKPRLYLAMSPGKLKIVKAKNWKTNRNPNGPPIQFQSSSRMPVYNSP